MYKDIFSTEPDHRLASLCKSTTEFHKVCQQHYSNNADICWSDLRDEICNRFIERAIPTSIQSIENFNKPLVHDPSHSDHPDWPW